MFTRLALTACFASLALAAPTRRSTPLSCVQFHLRWIADRVSGSNGFLQLFANVTQFHPGTQTTTFNETRIGLVDGRIDNCGECETTELFGFEVCQSPSREGFEGLPNSPNDLYGHLLYTNGQATVQCLQASDVNNLNGSSLVLADCQYEYDTVATSGQYFKLTAGGTAAQIVTSGEEVYGPNPSLLDSATVELYTGAATGPFTYFGFKSPF